MIEQEPLVLHQRDIETGVVVARLGTAGFRGTQRLIPFGPIAAYQSGEGGKIV